ncbi:MAG TPA: DUF402 domain-containing protein [Egibacteraceae bacterium]|nr:DUF402 domain-containing protein [Egibacteraceae bacterium]
MRTDYLPSDESSVRVFVTPPSGVIRLDDDVAVTEAMHGDVLLRHYAFADRWFKINVTTDRDGQTVETGALRQRFAFNCDIATPMEREGDATFAVDLFVDVLVRVDTRTLYVGDEDEFAEAIETGLMSRGEGQQARRGVADLIQLVEAGKLLPWLDDVFPFGPCDPPAAPPMRREPIPDRLLPHVRRSW